MDLSFLYGSNKVACDGKRTFENGLLLEESPEISDDLNDFKPSYIKDKISISDGKAIIFMSLAYWQVYKLRLRNISIIIL